METHVNFFINTQYNGAYYVQPHVHNCYELVYYKKGSGKTIISSKTYEFHEDTFAIIKPGSVHSESSPAGSEVMFVGFTLSDSTINEGIYYNETINIKKMMSLIQEEKENQKQYYKQLIDLLMQNIVILLLRYPTNKRRDESNFDDIVMYIKMNANKRLSIKEIATSVGYSYDYFRQMFARKYKMSAKYFILKTRLENVKQYLINTGLGFDRIAKDTGFSSASHLCAAFKKEFGISPRQYREQEYSRNMNVNQKKNVKDLVTCNKIITFSFDDNTQFDERLVKLFNKYKLVCTFNVNSGISNHDSKWEYAGVSIHRLTKEEMQGIYQGHEVAVHSLTHPHLFQVNDEVLKKEIKGDADNLREWFPNQQLLGMAYPYGEVDQRIMDELKNNGLVWGRNAGHSHSYDIPDNLLNYTPTCHFLDSEIDRLVDDFLKLKTNKKQVLFIWGHSNELETHHCWDSFEKLLKKLSGRKDIRYCNNSEALLG